VIIQGHYKWAKQRNGRGSFAEAIVELCIPGEPVHTRETEPWKPGERMAWVGWLEAAMKGAREMLEILCGADWEFVRVARFRGLTVDTDDSTAWLAGAMATVNALDAGARIASVSATPERQWIIEFDDGMKLLSPGRGFP